MANRIVRWNGAVSLAGLSLLATALPMCGQTTGPPPLSLSSLDPSSAVAGGPGFAMTVTGTGFNQSAQVIWRFGAFGAISLPTEYINPTQLQAFVLAEDIQTPGSYPVAVTQLDSQFDGIRYVSSNTASFTVVGGLSITTTCPLPNAIQNAAYSQTLTATGGRPPYSWSIASGSLPVGFSLSGGAITGMSGSAQTSSFTLLVVDSREARSTRACSLRVVPPTAGNVIIFSLDPPNAIAGSPTLTLGINGSGFATGASVIWNRNTPDETPLGTTVVNSGRLSVTVPANLLAQARDNTVIVRQATPPFSQVVFSNQETFTVLEALMITTPCPLREIPVGQAFSERLISTGGFLPHVWDVASGAVAPGLSLAANGTLSGTPTTPGVFRFTPRVTDARSNQTSRECSQLVQGPMSVSPMILNFASDGTGASPPPQDLSVFSAGGNVEFTTQLQTQSGNWLRAGATSLGTPSLVRVQTDVAGLAPGVHRGSIVFTSSQASNRSVTVEVVLTVRPGEAARLAARQQSMRFRFPRGATQAAQQLLRVLNLGTGSINFTAQAATSEGGNWLAVNPAQGTTDATTPASVRVTANPTGVNPGVYRGRIVLRGGGQEVTVAVILAISTSPQSMTLSQTGLVFQAAAGGPSPPRKEFQVLADGPNALFWETAVSTLSGGNWLSVFPPSDSSAPGAPRGSQVDVNPSGLAPDLYFGEIQVKSAAVDNTPQLISVVLQVLPAGGTPAAAIEPGGLVFTTVPGGPLPPAKQILIRNLSNAAADVSVRLNNSVPGAFTTGDQGTVTLPPGGVRRVNVVALSSALAAGAYRGSMAINLSGDPKVRLVDLLLVVGPGIPVAAAKDGGPREAAGCVPTRLIPVSTIQPIAFTAPTGLPVPMEVKVLDDCGDPQTNGAVIVSFAPGTQAPLPLVHLGDGRWSGTWQVSASTGPLTATIQADDISRNLAGTATLSGDVTATAGVPVISDGGVVSAAGVAAALGFPLAPGSLFSVFGTQLGTGINTPNGFPLPSLLGTTRVAIAGREVPLFFSGASQVNGMLPFDLTPNTTYQLSVRQGNRRSNYAEIGIAGSLPAVFSSNFSGSGQGIVVHGTNPTVLVDAANPIDRGGVVVIYLEGVGGVNRAVNAGEPSPGGPLAEAVAPVTVTIGGQPAQVVFAGLTPFFAGLFQINAIVSPNAATGNAVPVLVTAGGRASPPVAIGVR